jgi:hypothetical protein
MPLLLKNLTETIPDFKYHGVDIVTTVIDSVKLKFASEKNWKFEVLDFTSQSLPPGYELIYSRDALQHLPLLKVVDALEKFANAENARYLLVGSYLEIGIGEIASKINNKNIRTGDMFTINLTQAPFYLEKYEQKYKEGYDGWQKYLVLYDIPRYLKQIDFESMRKKIIKDYNINYNMSKPEN